MAFLYYYRSCIRNHRIKKTVTFRNQLTSSLVMVSIKILFNVFCSTLMNTIRFCLTIVLKNKSIKRNDESDLSAKKKPQNAHTKIDGLATTRFEFAEYPTSVQS